jgi:hypothetical protein
MVDPARGKGEPNDFIQVWLGFHNKDNGQPICQRRYPQNCWNDLSKMLSARHRRVSARRKLIRAIDYRLSTIGYHPARSNPAPPSV